ncbi:MAG: calcium/sodium antiporter [Pseudomonadota bacterium]
MPDLGLIAALVGGLILLAVAGDALVNGAVSLSRRAGVSPLVAGIFIVGFGTSAPELVVAIDAALSGYPGLALGNIVGSNIANVWLVLAAPALIYPFTCGGFGQKRALTVMLAATAAWIWILARGPLTPAVGWIFLAAFAGYGAYTFASTAAATKRGIDVGLDDEEAQFGVPIALLLVLAGLIGLPVGARLIVEGGVGVAQTFGVSDEVIGLTVLAFGTSLPEIGAAIAAALRRRAGIVIGNIIGSNLFNILVSGGVVALFGPVTAAPTFGRYDHWALAAAALTLAAVILPRARISRLSGGAMLMIYVIYIYGLVSGWNISALFTG